MNKTPGEGFGDSVDRKVAAHREAARRAASQGVGSLSMRKMMAEYEERKRDARLRKEAEFRAIRGLGVEFAETLKARGVGPTDTIYDKRLAKRRNFFRDNDVYAYDPIPAWFVSVANKHRDSESDDIFKTYTPSHSWANGFAIDARGGMYRYYTETGGARLDRGRLMNVGRVINFDRRPLTDENLATPYWGVEVPIPDAGFGIKRYEHREDSSVYMAWREHLERAAVDILSEPENRGS